MNIQNILIMVVVEMLVIVLMVQLMEVISLPMTLIISMAVPSCTRKKSVGKVRKKK
jgi:hypothetical protein